MISYGLNFGNEQLNGLLVEMNSVTSKLAYKTQITGDNSSVTYSSTKFNHATINTTNSFVVLLCCYIKPR